MKAGRPKEVKHADTNDAWRTAFCAMIAINLHQQYGAKVQHAVRTALKTVREASANADIRHWELLTTESVRHMVYRIQSGDAKVNNPNPSPGLMMRAASNLHATAKKPRKCDNN